MTLHKDYSAFIELLNAAKVEYLIVGAYALAIHGEPRNTGDIDFFISVKPENLGKIIRCLEEFGFPSGTFSVEDLERSEVVQVGFAPVRIDLLTTLSGIDFEQAWPNRIEREFGGLPVKLIGLQDFITNKEAVGRPQDLADAAKARELMQ